MKRSVFVSTLLTFVLGMGLVSCGDVNYEDGAFGLQSISGWEDCVGLDYQTAQLKRVGGRWKIVEGPSGNHFAFDFDDNYLEAYKSLQIIKRYKIKNSCFVGRPGPSFKYLLSEGQVSPFGNLVNGEDCISFNNQTVEVKWFTTSQSWKMIDGNMSMVDFGTKQAEAFKALRVVKKYKFNQQCFVGRPGPSFTYWKRTGIIVPFQLKPDLGAYGFLKIGQNGGKLVRWNETIILTPNDAFLFSNGNPAFNIYYAEKNYGDASAQGYANRIYLDGQLVSQQVNRPSLSANQKRNIHTQAYLSSSAGLHTLKIEIDDGNTINEKRENNNTFSVKVLFRGF